MRRFAKTLLSAATAAALACSLSVPAFGEMMTSQIPWAVAFTQADKMESNFNSEDIAQLVSDIQPGDTAQMAVTLTNENTRSTDWYMTTAILQSLEEAAESATGGAYAYDLSYTDPNGEKTTYFTSDTVGGDSTAGENQGLHEVSDITDEYFLLGSLAWGQEGVVRLDITLDGETQGNTYQDTLADLSMDFAVEFTPDDPGLITNTIRNPVNVSIATFAQTGDQLLGVLFAMCGIAAVGIIVLIIAIVGRRKGKKAKKEVR